MAPAQNSTDVNVHCGSNDAKSGSVSSAVQAAFENCPMTALRRLVIHESDEGGLLISGRVSTYYQKQQAQELARSNAPGVTVVNDVVVH